MGVSRPHSPFYGDLKVAVWKEVTLQGPDPHQEVYEQEIEPLCSSPTSVRLQHGLAYPD